VKDGVRGAKVQSIAETAVGVGFRDFIVIVWDDEDKWASTVSSGIEPQRLRDAAAFLLKTAGDQHG
jgi:hypothetical protein